MNLYRLTQSLIHCVFSRERIEPDNYRYYLASQQIFIATLILHILFIFLFSWLEIAELAYFNFFSIAVFSLMIYLNSNGHHILAIYPGYIEVNSHMLYSVYLLGWDTGFFYYILAIGPMLFFYPRNPLVWKIPLAFISALLLVVLYLYALDTRHIYALPENIKISLYIANLVCTFGLLSYLAYYYVQAADKSESRLRRMSSEFEKLATRDPLTGLLNRRAMHIELEKEVSRFTRDNKPFVLVIGDIDNFKSLNDKYGHLGGDEIIRNVTDVLLQGIREYDTICRWGGEEFFMILHNCRVDTGHTRMDKLRLDLAAHNIAYQDQIITTTITFGLCEYDASAGITECIEVADKALYRGKQSGKNCVVANAIRDKNG